MNIKIATPISTLFDDSSQYMKDVLELSNALEVRDISRKTDYNLTKIYHCEVSLLHKWNNEDMEGVVTKINQNNINFVSFHLLSCYTDYNIIKENKPFLPGRQKMSVMEMQANAEENLQLLTKKINNKIIHGIENNNYFPTGAYEEITEPKFINKLISFLKIKLLLDIGHAQITAHYKNIPLDDYINKLNLSQVYQIHLSSPTIKKDVCADSHKVLTEDDWEYFKKILPQCPNVKYVTIEYYRDIQKLMAMLKKLKEIIHEF